tara:strand:+ start:505 stop:774 length:270 start_codon:yes stop_codon:yes gene_type:complete
LTHSSSLSKRIVPSFIFSLLILLVLSACGQKGDLYLPNIPTSPNVINDEQESVAVFTSEDSADQDESSDIKKGKSITDSNGSLPATDAE